MRIVDYEAGKSLNDVALHLTRDEAEELSLYLRRLLESGPSQPIFLTEVSGVALRRELSIDLQQAS